MAQGTIVDERALDLEISKPKKDAAAEAAAAGMTKRKQTQVLPKSTKVTHNCVLASNCKDYNTKFAIRSQQERTA